jgi:hypothetical protein
MMARPSVSARTECRALLGTIAATPGRATCVTPSTVSLEFAVEHLVQLLLRMVMLMNRGAASEFVVRDGHVDGMEVSPSPTRQAFGHLELVDINERHGHTPALRPPERLGLRELSVLAASDSRAPPAILLRDRRINLSSRSELSDVWWLWRLGRSS